MNLIAPGAVATWKRAQASERDYWLRPEVQTKIRGRHRSGYYRDQAQCLYDAFSATLPVTRGRPVLQIGSAAIGAINWWPHPDRLAVDPMAPFFRRHFADVLTPAVTMVRGIAENLPLPNGAVEGLLATQIFGHLQDPVAALAEARRVLCVTGWLLCSVSDTAPAVVDPTLRRIWQAKEIRTFDSHALLSALDRSHFSVVQRVDHRQGDENRVFILALRQNGGIA